MAALQASTAGCTRAGTGSPWGKGFANSLGGARRGRRGRWARRGGEDAESSPRGAMAALPWVLAGKQLFSVRITPTRSQPCNRSLAEPPSPLAYEVEAPGRWGERRAEGRGGCHSPAAEARRSPRAQGKRQNEQPPRFLMAG